MSNISQPPEFDFWEFVSCGICHLEYIKESGALSNVPFWLTECGHVACNSHISMLFKPWFEALCRHRPLISYPQTQTRVALNAAALGFMS